MSQSIPTLASLDMTGKTVLCRVDFNVPLDGEVVADDTRIRRAIPTIQAIREKADKVVICSHLGRPGGEMVAKYSLLPAAAHLADLLDAEVLFAHDTIGDEVKDLIETAEPGAVIVLENLRFFKGEKKNDPQFAAALAGLADVFVNDAFGAMHRAHASITGVPALLPSAAGLLVQKEVEVISGLLRSPQRPFSAILGGAKVSDKIAVIDRMSQKVDHLFIGGAMAYTFLKAQGQPVGASLVEDDQLDFAANMIDEATRRGCRIHLPVDHVVADTFAMNAEAQVVDTIPDGMIAMDIGPKTVEAWSSFLSSSRSLLWNGPLGVFEWDAFSHGTRAIAETFANASGFTVIGGGDSAAAIAKFNLQDRMDHISTGGGATLEYLRDGDLVGLQALRKKR